jgi:hypothetical protein
MNENKMGNNRFVCFIRRIPESAAVKTPQRLA